MSAIPAGTLDRDLTELQDAVFRIGRIRPIGASGRIGHVGRKLFSDTGVGGTEGRTVKLQPLFSHHIKGVRNEPKNTR
jgi:hypothetical protein